MPLVILQDDGSLTASLNEQQKIPQEWECGIAPQVGNDAASRTMNDAASCPTRQQIKLAMLPQVVLQDDDSSRQCCRKSFYETTNQVGNVAARR